jgi:hypothetical protein
MRSIELKLDRDSDSVAKSGVQRDYDWMRLKIREGTQGTVETGSVIETQRALSLEVGLYGSQEVE